MKKMNVRELDCVLQQNVVTYNLDGEFYTGIVYELFNDYIDIEYEVLNGMKHGKETEYQANRKVKSICHYKFNYLDGIAIEYDDEGEVIEECLFKDGQYIESIV